MRGLLGLLITAVIVVLGYWYFVSKTQSSGAPAAPAQAISTVGVQSDLLSIAQAERIYWTSHNSYASLDELYSSGALAVKKSGRAGYTYSAETSSGGFTVTARCDAAATPGCPSFAVDESMQVHPIP
ncbi:MAG: type IV pilin protein [Candidatus Acidiferrales bacterium]